jgi:pyrroloquinoline quinone (PQQ) biosynthesis protein C
MTTFAQHLDTVGAAPAIFAPMMDEIQNHPTLRHPFLRRFAEEQLSREQIAAFATQHYLYSRSFARNLAAVISNVPDEAARNLLVLNMYEEIGEPNRINDRLYYLLVQERLVTGPILGVAIEEVSRRHQDTDLADYLIGEQLVSRQEIDDLLDRHRSQAADATHPALFRRFLRALGHDGESLRQAVALPETTAFIDEFEAVCRRTTWLEGLGGLGPGTECVVPTLYAPLLQGIERSGVVSPADYIFWTIHVKCDDEHGANILASLAPHASSPKVLEAIRRGAMRVLDARRRWFDALERHVFCRS